MRVLIVNANGADLASGGTERHIDRMLRGLPKRGVEVMAVASFPPLDPTSQPTVLLNTVHWRDSLVRRVSAQIPCAINREVSRVTELLEQFCPDIVNTHNLPGIGTGVWATCARLGIPVVHTVNDLQIHCRLTTLMTRRGTPCDPRRCGCSLRRRSMLRHRAAVTHLVAGTRFAMQMHEHHFPHAQRIIVPNAAPAAPRVPPPSPDGLRSVGYIGGLNRIKGVQHLLSLAPTLRARGITVHIGGRGQYTARAQELDRRGDIVYWGHVTEERKPEFLAAADVGIVPSIWQEVGGPPYVVLEWLSADRPVLLTRRGCLGELIDEVSGCYETTDGPSGLLASIERIGRPENWESARAGAVRAQFDQTDDSWLDRYMDIFADALARRSAG